MNIGAVISCAKKMTAKLIIPLCQCLTMSELVKILTSLVSGTDGELLAFKSGVGEFVSKFNFVSTSALRSLAPLTNDANGLSAVFVFDDAIDNWAALVFRPDAGARSMIDGRGTSVGPIDPKSYGLFLPDGIPSWGEAKLAAPSSYLCIMLAVSVNGS